MTLRCIDLFAGAGGTSTGAAMAGLYGVEPVTSHSTVTPSARARRTAVSASIADCRPLSMRDTVACETRASGTLAASASSRIDSLFASRACFMRSPKGVGEASFAGLRAGIGEAAMVCMWGAYVNIGVRLQRQPFVVVVATRMVRLPTMKATHGELRLLQIVGTELEVDADGRVWRIALRRAGRLWPTQRRRCEFANRDGYLRVQGGVDGRRVRALAHRLVWAHAFGAIPDGIEINHKDGDKSNNRLDNLEAVTPSQNVRHSLRALGRKRVRGERHPQSVLSDEVVRMIRARVSTGETRSAISRELGVSRSTVEGAANGKRWRHVT